MGSNRQYRKVPLTLYAKQFRWADETLPSFTQRQQKEKKKHTETATSAPKLAATNPPAALQSCPPPKRPRRGRPHRRRRRRDIQDDARDIHDDSLLANTGACFLFNLSDAVAHTDATVSGLRIGGGKLLGMHLCTHVKMLTMTSVHCSCFCSA